jgi:hypothetical protein
MKCRFEHLGIFHHIYPPSFSYSDSALAAVSLESGAARCRLRARPGGTGHLLLPASAHLTAFQMSAMLRLSLAFKQSKESMYSVLQSLGPKDAAARSRMDKRLGGGTAAMLAKLSCAQLQRSDKLLHSVRHCRFSFDLVAIRPYVLSLQAATSNGFSSFDELVRDAFMLDAALGSNSGAPPPPRRRARCSLHVDDLISSIMFSVFIHCRFCVPT